MNFKKTTYLLSIMAVFIMTGAVWAGTLPINLLLQVDTGVSNQYDFAMTSQAAHVVYQKNGNVYYSYISAGNLSWTTVNLGTGNWPTIASNDNNEVMIAYENGGTIYALEASSLTPVQVLSNVTNGKPTLSSPFFASGWQMSIEGNLDGDSYAEIARVYNFGIGWSTPEILLDGQYSSGSGSYYGQASIAAFADRSYALAFEHKAWEGNAFWSAKYARVNGPESQSIAKYTGWNSSVSLSRRAVHCISEDGSAKAVFAFAINNQLYAAINEGSGWSWLFQGYGNGSAPAVSWGGGTYADSTGKLHFVSTDEEGQLIDDILVYEEQDLYGTNPLIWAMEDKFFLFKDGNGNLMFGGCIVPEPGTMASLLTGIVGLIGMSRIRRRSA